jgi:hypothetical protein
MTGRERVARCVAMDHPDRVPRDLWMLPGIYLGGPEQRAAVEAFQSRWPTDMTCPNVPDAPKSKLGYGNPFVVGQSRDEWGCIFVNIQEGVHGEVKEPVLNDWSKLADLHVPEELLAVNIDSVNRFCAQSSKYVLAGACPRPFERIQFLRGSENVYMDLAEGAPELTELLEKVHGFYLKELEIWARTKVDALRFMDDWGSQRSLLISPEQWRKWFKPLYAQYAQIAHAAGKKLFMHSDGYIMDIYEDLIEIGVDAINSQLFCMDMEEIGRRFAGRITFWGEFDRQYLMPYGSRAEVLAGMERLQHTLFRPEGGVIAQFELGRGSNLQNAELVYEQWAAMTH